MKKTILLLTALFLISCVGLQTRDYNPDTGFTGFNGISFETDIKDCPELKFLVDLPSGAGKQYFNPSEEYITYLGYKVLIRYNFYHDKFDGVALVFGPDYNPEALGLQLKDTYGYPDGIMPSAVMWQFPKARLVWFYEARQIVIISTWSIESWNKEQEGKKGELSV